MQTTKIIRIMAATSIPACLLAYHPAQPSLSDFALLLTNTTRPNLCTSVFAARKGALVDC